MGYNFETPPESCGERAFYAVPIFHCVAGSVQKTSPQLQSSDAPVHQPPLSLPWEWVELLAIRFK